MLHFLTSLPIELARILTNVNTSDVGYLSSTTPKQGTDDMVNESPEPSLCVGVRVEYR